MSMLAEQRRKTKWVINPLKKPLWTTDSSGIQFGKQLMEKMGWSAGKGLGLNEQGIQEPLKVAYKNDSKGMGFKENLDDWIEHQDEFNTLLSQLRNNNDSSLVKDSNDENTEIKSLEEKSKQSKARVHYQKFTRGKDLSKYTANDLACILGTGKTKTEKVKTEDVIQTETKVNGNCETSFGVTTINSGSIQDYFKKKWIIDKHKFLGTDDKFEESKDGFNNEKCYFSVHDEGSIKVESKEKKSRKRKHKSSSPFEHLPLGETKLMHLDETENLKRITEKIKKKNKKEKFVESDTKSDESYLEEEKVKAPSEEENTVNVEIVKKKKRKKDKKEKSLECETKSEESYLEEEKVKAPSEEENTLNVEMVKKKKRKKDKKEKSLDCETKTEESYLEEEKVKAPSEEENTVNVEIVKKKKRKKDKKEKSLECETKTEESYLEEEKVKAPSEEENSVNVEFVKKKKRKKDKKENSEQNEGAIESKSNQLKQSILGQNNSVQIRNEIEKSGNEVICNMNNNNNNNNNNSNNTNNEGNVLSTNTKVENRLQKLSVNLFGDKAAEKYFPEQHCNERVLKLIRWANISEFRGSNLKDVDGYGHQKMKNNLDSSYNF